MTPYHFVMSQWYFFIWIKFAPFISWWLPSRFSPKSQLQPPSTLLLRLTQHLGFHRGFNQGLSRGFQRGFFQGFHHGLHWSLHRGKCWSFHQTFYRSFHQRFHALIEASIKASIEAPIEAPIEAATRTYSKLYCDTPKLPSRPPSRLPSRLTLAPGLPSGTLQGMARRGWLKIVGAVIPPAFGAASHCWFKMTQHKQLFSVMYGRLSNSPVQLIFIISKVSSWRIRVIQRKRIYISCRIELQSCDLISQFEMISTCQVYPHCATVHCTFMPLLIISKKTHV